MAGKKKTGKKNTKSKKSIKYTILYTILAILLVGLSIGIDQVYRMCYKNICTKSGESTYLYVYTRMSLDELMAYMKTDYAIESPYNFRLHAKLLHFTHVMPGRYKVDAVEADLNFIRRLRNGEQTPVKVTFNNIRTKQQLAKCLSEQLLVDSASIASLLNDANFLKDYGMKPETAVCLFIPNTYEMYWSVSARGLVDKFYSEYKRFWNQERLEKAEKAGLTPVEVAILASIVEEETNKASERPIVAGLYINRLRKGMLLQADPTVKFAVGDFGIRRVLNKHLQIDSPYNTYKYKGLPPGPIRIPTAAAMDAVLNYTKHKYIYMCAKETFNGEHNFATTLAEHNRNAARYQKALNQRRIMR